MTANSPANPPDASPDTSEEGIPREGEVLAGKYRVERVLGQGGMGVVVAAEHITLRQRVAVKLLLPDAAKRVDSAERFMREARASVSIQSEHVTRVLDVGQADTGAPYIAMEFLTGKDLGDALAVRGRFGVEESVDYVLQACEAIAEAHSLGIIHRDLKPANLFLTQRPDGSPLVKVLDFGLSKVTRPDVLDQSLTAANVIMGSPCYMSPEQIRSLKDLDARTDIWALGVILYQILTGARPFDAPSMGALFFIIGADPPAPMKDHRPDVPPELEAVVLRCLEKDKTKRIQTIAELARALAPFAPERSRISIDSIHRVLNDTSAIPARRASLPSTVADLPLSDDDGDNAPTLMRDPLMGTSHRSVPPPPGTGTQPISASASNPPPSPTASKPLPAPPAPLAASPVVSALPAPEHQMKSGSVPAIANDQSAPSIPRARPPSNRGGMVGAIVAVAAVAAIAVAFFAIRSTSSHEPLQNGTSAAAAHAGGPALGVEPAHTAGPDKTAPDAGAPKPAKP